MLRPGTPTQQRKTARAIAATSRFLTAMLTVADVKARPSLQRRAWLRCQLKSSDIRNKKHCY